MNAGKRSIVVAAVVLLAFSWFAGAAAEVLPTPITAKVISVFHRDSTNKKRFGQLSFIGGIELRSTQPHFGGLSGLRVQPGVAGDAVTVVADTGFWFTAKLERDAGGRPVGMSNGKMAALLNSAGQQYLDKWSIDAEGLTRRGDSLLVSTEQFATVQSFSTKDNLFKASAQLVVTNWPGGRLRNSFGLEALATVPTGQHKGALLAVSEGSLDALGHIRAFLIEGEVVRPLAVKQRDHFLVTDADFLPNGDLLLLERRFTIGYGQQMRIRRVPADSIKPGAVLDGDFILDVNREHHIDNMEGLSVFRSSDGKVRIGVISDDNHWLLQRTLYLEFEFAD